MRPAGRRLRFASWLGAATRAGHAAKGTIYGATAAVGFWRVAGGSGETGGARRAVQTIAGTSFGRAALGVLAVGLSAFALSRLTLALYDPERAGWRKRGLNLAAAIFHAALIVFVAQLLFGGEAARTEEPARLARALARPRGRWIVSAFGIGLLALGVRRIVRPAGDRAGGGPSPVARTARGWSAIVGSAASAARATLLLAVGAGLLYAAAAATPHAGPTWISALFACCLLILAANEWTRARYAPDALAAASAPPGVSPPAARTSPIPPAAPACTDRRRSRRSDPPRPGPSG